MSYDYYYRGLCENPEHYDRMIALIMQHDTSCTGVNWASDSINDVIHTIMVDEVPIASMGMITAIKTPDGKIRLFLEPIGKMISMLGTVLRDRELYNPSKKA